MREAIFAQRPKVNATERSSPYYNTGLNPYDIREKCKVKPLCYNFTDVDLFLDDASVQKRLGVPEHMEWSSCNFTVNAAFSNDWMRSFAYTIPDLLKEGVRVLIYAGGKSLCLLCFAMKYMYRADCSDNLPTLPLSPSVRPDHFLTCELPCSLTLSETISSEQRWILFVNWIGDKAWTLNLDWEGKEGFASEGDHKWINKDGETAGFART